MRHGGRTGGGRLGRLRRPTAHRIFPLGMPDLPPGSDAGGRDSGWHRRAPGHHGHLMTTPPRRPSVQERAWLDRANGPVLPHCLLHRPASPVILSADTSPPDGQPWDGGRLSGRSPWASPPLPCRQLHGAIQSPQVGVGQRFRPTDFWRTGCGAEASCRSSGSARRNRQAKNPLRSDALVQ
jgi:hypothetical protein